MSNFSLVAIGASAGGVEAIQDLLEQLRPNFSIPIAIVQHLPAKPRIDVTHVYRRLDGVENLEVEDKMPIKPGHIYLAAPDYHLLVEESMVFSLTQDEMQRFSRPSIDVFFHSAAISLKSRCIGVLLSGANEDGAEGLNKISIMGGVTLVQDPGEASFPAMPHAAIKRFQPNHVLSVKDIANYLNKFDRTPNEN